MELYTTAGNQGDDYNRRGGWQRRRPNGNLATRQPSTSSCAMAIGVTNNADERSERCGVCPGSQRPGRRNEPAEWRARSRDWLSIVGLGHLPINWPTLPPNDSLRTELQWVLANRIRCVDESGDQTVVNLSLAITTTTSYATLGWLEISIRAIAKFVDCECQGE